MVEPLASLFSSPDPLSLLISFAFFFGIISIGLKKKETPLYLALLNFLMVFTLYISLGVASPYFALVIIFASSFLLTRFMSNMFLGNYGGESKIMLTYLIFFSATFFLMNYANVSSGLFGGNIGKLKSPTCDLNLDLLILGKIVFCAINYIGYFYNLLTFNSTIGLINAILLVPWFYFIWKYLADWFRGRGGGS